MMDEVGCVAGVDGETRSAAAVEGIALLKAGSEAVKHSRKGKPQKTTFRLSADERELQWEGHGMLARTGLDGHSRVLRLADVLEVLVGQESALFQRLGMLTAHEAHLSLSLVLLPSDPDASAAKPAEDRRSGDRMSRVGTGLTTFAAPEPQRDSLDLSLQDEEQFGLWYAARASNRSCRATKSGALSGRRETGAEGRRGKESEQGRGVESEGAWG